MEKMKDTLSVLAQDKTFIISLIILALALAFISFQVGHSAGVASVDQSSDISPEIVFHEDSSDPATPAEPLDPVTLSGTGQTATDPVELIAGLTTVKIKHSGEGHFSIWVLDESGENVELLVNETGFFDGSKAFQIPSNGKYVLDVSADGPWEVVIQQ